MTASHTPHAGPDTPKNSKMIVSTLAAQNRLVDLHADLGTWQAVAVSVSGGRLDRGLLCRIARGRQRAPRSVLKALHLLPPPKPSKRTRRRRLWRSAAWRSACATTRRPAPRSLWDWPVRALALALRERR